MEASRFPNDFDGIIAGAPAMDATDLGGALFAFLLQSNTGADGKPIFTNAKLRLVTRAATAAVVRRSLELMPMASQTQLTALSRAVSAVAGRLDREYATAVARQALELVSEANSDELGGLAGAVAAP